MTGRYEPGVIVAVMVGGVWHEGVSTGAGTVVHKSKRTGRVAEEDLSRFAVGRVVRVIGYPGALPSDVVVGRARARMGERWDLWRNCQAFARECHGVAGDSPDMRGAVLFTGLAVAGVAVARRWVGKGRRRR